MRNVTDNESTRIGNRFMMLWNISSTTHNKLSMRASNLIEKSIEQSFKIGKISKTIKKILKHLRVKLRQSQFPQNKSYTHFLGAHAK